MPDVDASELMADAALLAEVVREAGKIALAKRGPSLKSWRKPDGSMVTEGDLAVDDFLKRQVTAARPGDAWLSEETPDTPLRLASERLWIFDPIDGTRSYLSGGEYWCVGGALAVRGSPVVAAIYRPLDDVLFTAVRGQGTRRNGETVRIAHSSGGGTVIAPKSLASRLAAFGLVGLAGSGLPLLMRFVAIAEGRATGAISIGDKNDWDIAAGHLILTEAGGRVSTQAGAEVIYNLPQPWQPGVVAAAAQWHDKILDCTRAD